MFVHCFTMTGNFLGKCLGKFVRCFRQRSELYLFGSSILWGQGHAPPEKIGTKVAEWIEERFGERVKLHLLAHSGALLTGDPEGGVKSCHGEVPTAWPSIMAQVRSARMPRSEKVRILIEGGINDVGGGEISNPMTAPEYLLSATEAACYGKMKEVLREISKRFPNAEIYVIGYYQILAEGAKVGEVKDMLREEGMASEEMEGDDFNFRERAVENSQRFREISDHWLAKAVKEIAVDHPGICEFVASGFEPWEGMFGMPTLVYNPWSRDAMQGRRAKHCALAIARGRTGLHCFLAATAHPNTEGTARYVSRITAAMEAAAGR